MKTVISFVICSIFLLSCSSEESKGKEKLVVETADVMTEESTQEVIQKTVVYPSGLLSKQEKLKTINLPFKSDSTYLRKFKSGKEMSDSELKILLSNFQTSEKYDEGYAYDVVRMNWLKKVSQYEEYTENLDLAQLKNATAHWLGKIEKGDSALILWSVSYSSYEACPYYTGNEIFSSLIKDGIVLKSYRIGGFSSAGDPPVSFESFENFTINEDFSISRRMNTASFEDEKLNEKSKFKDVIKL